MAVRVQVPNLDGGRLRSSFSPDAAAVIDELVSAVRNLALLASEAERQQVELRGQLDALRQAVEYGNNADRRV